LRATRCVRIGVGVEGGAQRIRDLYDKGFSNLLQFTPVPWARLHRHVDPERRAKLPQSLAEWEAFYRGYLEASEVA